MQCWDIFSEVRKKFCGFFKILSSCVHGNHGFSVKYSAIFATFNTLQYKDSVKTFDTP